MNITFPATWEITFPLLTITINVLAHVTYGKDGQIKIYFFILLNHTKTFLMSSTSFWRTYYNCTKHKLSVHSRKPIFLVGTVSNFLQLQMVLQFSRTLLIRMQIQQQFTTVLFKHSTVSIKQTQNAINLSNYKHLAKQIWRIGNEVYRVCTQLSHTQQLYHFFVVSILLYGIFCIKYLTNIQNFCTQN